MGARELFKAGLDVPLDIGNGITTSLLAGAITTSLTIGWPAALAALTCPPAAIAGLAAIGAAFGIVKLLKTKKGIEEAKSLAKLATGTAVNANTTRQLLEWLRDRIIDGDLGVSKETAARMNDALADDIVKRVIDEFEPVMVELGEQREDLANLLTLAQTTDVLLRELLAKSEALLPLVDVLPRIARLQARVETELDLLHPFCCSTELVGRNEDLDDLEAWLALDKRISVRTMIGRAGAGKTRLALELIRRLHRKAGTEPMAPTWHMGFLSLNDLQDARRRHDFAQWKWQWPTLVVLDYAGAGGADLREWLATLANNQARGPESTGPPLRILLLEREASVDAGWLGQLRPGGQTDTDVQWLFDPVEPIEVKRLHAADLRRSLFADMLGQCARLLGADCPNVPSPGEDEAFDLKLKDDQWADPLYLIMAAAVAVRSHIGHALSLSRTDLGFNLAGHEASRIGRFAPDGEGNKKLICLLGACATLGRGLTRSQSLAMAEQIERMTGYAYTGGHGQLVNDAASALSGDDQGIAPVLPDMIGEALAYKVIKSTPLSDQQRDTLLAFAANPEIAGHNVVEFVIHLIQNYAADRPDTLDWLDGLVEQFGSNDLDVLVRVVDALPENTLVLRERAAKLQQQVIDLMRPLAEADSDNERLRPEFAMALNNQGLRLSDLGKSEDALKVAEEAVRLHRELTAVYSEVLSPGVALSLNNLSHRLSDLGRREEALGAAKEAIALYRDLAKALPNGFRGDLGMSLNTLSRMQRDMGQLQAAMEAAAEAVSLYRELAAGRSGAFLPQLAMSLNNLSTYLSELGDHEAALKWGVEAVSLYRELAAERPDAVLPNLAASLANLANRLIELGRLEKALESAEEAVVLRREMASARPDAFGPNLAMSCGAMGRVHAALVNHVSARAAYAEGIKSLAPLFIRLPEAHDKFMAMLVQDYLQASKEAGEHPDEELLRPVAEVFERLKVSEESE